MIKKLLPKTNN